MNARDLSSADAQVFTDKMIRAFGGFLIEQETMSRLSKDLLSVDLPALIPQNSITLGLFVYLKSHLAPWQQVLSVTHACQYLSQAAGRVGEWLWFYAAQPEMRARYVAEALRAEMELQYTRTGTLPTRDQAETVLRGSYQLATREVELGLMLMERAATAARSGVLTTEAARVAIDALK